MVLNQNTSQHLIPGHPLLLYGANRLIRTTGHSPVYVCWQMSNLLGSRRIIFQYESYESYDVSFGHCVKFWSPKRNKSNTPTEPHRNKYGVLKNNACFYYTIKHTMIQQPSQTAICQSLVLFELPKQKTSYINTSKAQHVNYVSCSSCQHKNIIPQQQKAITWQ